MGGLPCKIHDRSPSHEGAMETKRSVECGTMWRKEGYHGDYSKSPVLPDDRDDLTEYIELLAMLDDPAGQNFLGNFAMEIGTQHLFFFWSDAQEYRAIPTVDYRFTKAKQIYAKYLRHSSPAHLSFVPEKVRSDTYEYLQNARQDRELLGPEFFLELQKSCFKEIFDHTFLKLKEEHELRYRSYIQGQEEAYNRIDVDDFLYMEKLGEGAFGKVVHVVKKSTGRHYAMKIQRKKELLRSFAQNPSKLDNEKMVFQACQNPFVLHMDYALQTEHYAIIVLNLITSGNLQDAIDKSPKKRLEDARVTFYTAEISLALFHLHDMGLMYRDLKPRNVMLAMDGHVQLADMGGVGDSFGDMSARKIRKPGTVVRRNEVLKNFKRRSIMGTKGYMAPEMAKLLNQSDDERQGYNEAVDWWSLGVTVYKMLTGMRPFDPPPWQRRKSVLVMLRRQTEYEKLQMGVQYPPYMSEPSVAFISALLRQDVSERLGSGPGGKEDIKGHRFFSGILWEPLSAKAVEPPYIPPKTPLFDEPHYDTFEDMMYALHESDRRFGRRKFSHDELTPEEQKYFSTWRYVNPQTLKVEMGISKEMDDMEANFKVVQITGESSLSGSSSGLQGTNGLLKAGLGVKSLSRAISNLGANATGASAASGTGGASKGRVDPSAHSTGERHRPAMRPRITLVKPHP